MRARLLIAAAICAAFFVPASANAGVTMCDIDPSQRTVNVPCRVDSATPVGVVVSQQNRTVIGCQSSPCGSFNSPPYIAWEGGVAYWWSGGVVGLDKFCVGWGEGSCATIDPGSPPTPGVELDRPVAVCFFSTSGCIKI